MKIWQILMRLFYLKEDVLFYQNPCYPLRFYSVSINEDETLMFLYESGGGSGTNLFVRDLRVPNSQFIQMTSNMDMQYSPIEIIGEKIYMFTNDGAPMNRLMVTDLKHPAFKDWKVVVPESSEVLEDVTFVDDKMILSYSKDASSHAFLYTLEGKLIKEIKLPSLGRARFYGKRQHKECLYSFSSFTVPGTIYQYDVATNSSSVYAAPKVNFDASKFITEQVFFSSKDGAKIPMFLTYKKDLRRNGKNPVYLYGYGGFNISLTWRDFDLSTYMYYSIGNDLYKHYEYYTMFGNLQSNYSKDRLAKSWDPVNHPYWVYPIWLATSTESP